MEASNGGRQVAQPLTRSGSRIAEELNAALHLDGATSDEEFEPVSYEVTASRLKPGCAEGAIANGFLELIAPPR